ncbi:MAG: HD domain-containing protein [Bacteroidales bacterium]|nr:HD domain-containing protein [Bacteroidales bacterium]
MSTQASNRKKIFNDPVYGFISIPDSLHFDLIEHAYFQRLRRIKQLGLTHLVYAGALHTRFHHSLGAMHLMQQAIAVLRSKGQQIPEEEAQAASLAILLHDIGHGPYSHTLEKTIVQSMTHEQLSSHIMRLLNKDFNNQLEKAIQIFEGSYHRKFLCQLVSSQLDMDRMDYLKRDSFFTGVAEGTINADRLLTMLDVADDNLVIEAKGIYSVENFLVARRLMYWQVYLHKTVLSAEYMLTGVLKRAKQLSAAGHELPATPALSYFLKNDPSSNDFVTGTLAMEMFTQLDDFDVFTSLKMWQHYPDKILSLLSGSIVNRRLFKVELSNEAFDPKLTNKLKARIASQLKLEPLEAELLFIEEATSNHAYHPLQPRINILFRDGSLRDISEASDQLNISVLSQPVTRHFICYPKWLL